MNATEFTNTTRGIICIAAIAITVIWLAATDPTAVHSLKGLWSAIKDLF